MPIIPSESAVPGVPAIYVEVETPTPQDQANYYTELRNGPADQVLGKARDVFGDGLELARVCARRVAENLKSIEQESQIDEFTLQLAIKLDSELGAFIAKASAGAQLQVEIKWKRGAGASRRET